MSTMRGGAKLISKPCNSEVNNHRSWHPVFRPTGRTAAIRGLSSDPAEQPFLPPWNGSNIGNQTMYCTDCHGSNTAVRTPVTDNTVFPDGGEDGNPWGPHGSTNDFLLKGPWDPDTGQKTNPDALCFRCHNFDDYAKRPNLLTNPPPPHMSGFRTPAGYTEPEGCMINYKDINLHIGHVLRFNLPQYFRCKWCHVTVVHGWKNKAMLVNLNDIGPEAGLPAGTVKYYYNPADLTDGSYTTGSGQGYSQEPYYDNAKLAIFNFAKSGEWISDDCGRGGGTGGWMVKNCGSPPP